MSWDVFVANTPDAEHLTELGEDESLYPPLGDLRTVRARLKAYFPQLDLTDPTWGDLDGGDFSIEFSIGSEDPVTSLMLHVRGEDRALGVIWHLCQHSGWVAFDSDGPRLSPGAETVAGFTAWREQFERSVAAATAAGKHVYISPRLNGVRFDMLVQKEKPRRWWQFWRRA